MRLSIAYRIYVGRGPVPRRALIVPGRRAFQARMKRQSLSRATRNMHPCRRGFKPRLPGEGLSRATL